MRMGCRGEEGEGCEREDEGRGGEGLDVFVSKYTHHTYLHTQPALQHGPRLPLVCGSTEPALSVT